MPAARDWILVGTTCCNMYLVNPANLSFKLVNQAHNSQIVGLDVQGTVMASFDHKATLRLWNINEGYRALRTVPNHPLNNSPGSTLAFGESPFLLQGFENGDINCLNASTGKQEWSLLKTHKGGVTTMLMVLAVKHRTSCIW
jgi:WD40 repeat protein